MQWKAGWALLVLVRRPCSGGSCRRQIRLLENGEEHSCSSEPAVESARSVRAALALPGQCFVSWEEASVCHVEWKHTSAPLKQIFESFSLYLRSGCLLLRASRDALCSH